MNMKNQIETERLILLPGENARDNDAFLIMLKQDGDFRLFSGVDYSDLNLSGFDGYLERDFLYAVYRKNEPNELLGYVGIALQHERYEAEFYMKKSERQKGYCEEALKALCRTAFAGNLVRSDEKEKRDRLFLNEIYATTIDENVPAKKLLQKSGFAVSNTGAKLIFQIMCNPVTGRMYENHIAEYVLEKP